VALIGVTSAAVDAVKEAVHEHELDDTSRAVADGDVDALTARVEQLRRAAGDPGDQ
jgi:hypothetical protein